MTRRSKSQNHTKTLICNYKCTMDGTRCTALQSPSADNVLAQYVTLGRNHVLVPIYQVDSWEHFIGHRLETNSLASQEFQPARPPPPCCGQWGDRTDLLQRLQTATEDGGVGEHEDVPARVLLQRPLKPRHVFVADVHLPGGGESRGHPETLRAGLSLTNIKPQRTHLGYKFCTLFCTRYQKVRKWAAMAPEN